MKWVADMLQTPLEELQESHHKHPGILHASTSMKIVIPANEDLKGAL